MKLYVTQFGIFNMKYFNIVSVIINNYKSTFKQSFMFQKSVNNSL
jgi:hypothetical protein